MRARTPRAAVDDFLARLREPVSCLVARPLLATGHRVESRPQYVSLAPVNEPANLRRHRGGRITFSFRCEYEIVPAPDAEKRFEARLTGYWYEIGDALGRELIAFHWHPDSVSPVRFPHLHLTSQTPAIAIAEGQSVSLSEMHIPGSVSMSDIVRLLIVEFGVEPRRPDWKSTLRDA